MLLWVPGRGLDGAGDRNRTYDLRVTSALLYRLSYTGLLNPKRADSDMQSISQKNFNATQPRYRHDRVAI
jgi:hypothetical protein